MEGLVDNRRAAALLGVDVSTFRVWATRAKTSSQGVPSLMPQPIGTMHGNVYREEDIRILDAAIRARKTEKKLPLMTMTLTEKRRLGSYFTSSDATNLMVEWALRDPSETVLEPSLGDGSFLRAIQQHANTQNWPVPHVRASEIDPATAQGAVEAGLIDSSELHVGDFLTSKHPPVNAVVGNPPYVRIRALDQNQATNALRATEKAMGAPMDPAGSVWMPFVAKSTSELKMGGRLAFVLPLDFTYVRYARPLWKFLGENFGNIRILRFRQRIFPEILQNVLILLADEKGRSTNSIKFSAYESIAEYDPLDVSNDKVLDLDRIVSGDRVFQEALLSPDSADAYHELIKYSTAAKSRLKFNIGYVSGNKEFFHPSRREIELHNIPETSLRSSAVNTRQLSGASLRTSELDNDQFLWLPSGPLTAGELSYVSKGEESKVNEGYKCKIRNPWYRVPGVKIPDVLLTVFSETPRLYINDGGWAASNSILCGYLREGEDAVGFAASWYSALTLLSSELQVHSLGGGVMVAVPNEADSIQVLTRTATKAIDPNRLSLSLLDKKPLGAYALGDESISNVIGKDAKDSIWEGVEKLAHWRNAKS
ncbi:hypothetical protein ART_3383 [Arthrobacter sp. PAMC 25486]|uniref:Eco57I restriction-modification methylase domain-containing protein n=1 Tax=Arthrobacter sp. PAMC 25486 TaxID=1494608 RepID=UPI000535E66A|nr:N-6 DNA methylase [Arthrobacter sp. PAMC 25486]AIY02982.1 hypothetical protein ART_3383 [Arthrobacter sp. PAMC 25486]